MSLCFNYFFSGQTWWRQLSTSKAIIDGDMHKISSVPLLPPLLSLRGATCSGLEVTLQSPEAHSFVDESAIIIAAGDAILCSALNRGDVYFD